MFEIFFIGTICVCRIRNLKSDAILAVFHSVFCSKHLIAARSICVYVLHAYRLQAQKRWIKSLPKKKIQFFDRHV